MLNTEKEYSVHQTLSLHTKFINAGISFAVHMGRSATSSCRMYLWNARWPQDHAQEILNSSVFPKNIKQSLASRSNQILQNPPKIIYKLVNLPMQDLCLDIDFEQCSKTKNVWISRFYLIVSGINQIHSLACTSALHFRSVSSIIF